MRESLPLEEIEAVAQEGMTNKDVEVGDKSEVIEALAQERITSEDVAVGEEEGKWR